MDHLVVVMLPNDPVDDPVAVAGAASMFAVTVGGFQPLPFPAFGFWYYLDQSSNPGEFARVESPARLWHVRTLAVRLTG